MKVKIGHLAKTLNSTEFRFDALSDIETVTLDLVLKEPTNKYQPTFMLLNTKQEDQKTVPKYFEGYNYMYVPKWGYYTIDSITYETNEIISFHCTRDVLATGHDYIKSGYMYLKYCSSVKDTINPRLGLLDDDRFGPDLFAGVNVFNFAGIGGHGHPGNSFWGIANGPGGIDYYAYKPADATIALTTNSLGSGAVTFFMSVDDFGKVMTAMNTFADGINAMDDLVKQFVFGVDWRDCFISAKMIPIKLQYINTILGEQKHTLAAGAVDDVLDDGTEFVYTKSPQMFFGRRNKIDIEFIDMLENQMYKWLRGPKYTTICFEYPGGSLDLSSDAFVDHDTIVFVESLNLINGDYSIKFYLDNDTEEEKENGTCIGAARMDLSIDILDMMTHIDPMTNIQSIVNKTLSASAAVATTALGVHLGQQGSINAANVSYNMGQVQYQRMRSQAKTPSGVAAAAAFRDDNYMQFGNAVEQASRNAKSEMLQMGTGILGQYSSTNAVPVKSSYALGGGLVPFYEAWEAGADAWKFNQCRLVVTTNVPAIFYEDKDTVNDQTPAGDTIYAKFGDQYGLPIYRYIDFSDTELEDLGSKLVMAIGANCGFSGYLYGREPDEMKFTLTKSELSELNTQLNTNGIYLDAINDEHWGEDIED